MKLAIVLLTIVFALGVTSSTSAQEGGSQEPVGSVWDSEQMELTVTSDPGTVQPMQMGLSGTAEAIGGMTWYGNAPLLYNVVGTAISKVISGSYTYNVCAQVLEVSRNGVNKGGSDRLCGEIGVGGSLQRDHKVWEDWHGATWRTRTFHEFARTGSYWAPTITVEQNL